MKHRLVLTLALVLALPSGLCAQAAAQTDHFAQALQLYNDKKPDEALNELDLAHRAAPNDPHPLYWIGVIKLQQQKLEEAQGPLEQAVKLDPASVEAHFTLGSVYDGLKRYPDAANEFQSVARLQPNSPDAYYNLGTLYLKMERPSDSVAAFRKAVALKPDDAGFQHGLGLALRASHHYEEAVAGFERATGLAPNNPDLWIDYGQAAADLAQSLPDSSALKEPAWNRARTALARAVDLNPKDYRAHEVYGEILVQSGHDVEAVGQLTAAVGLASEPVDALYNLGLAEAQAKHWPEAQDAYRRALILQPDNEPALLGLGLTQMALGQFDAAIKTYTLITRQDSDSLVGWIHLAYCLEHQGDKKGAYAANLAACLTAVEEDARLEKNNPRMANVHFALANYYTDIGDADSLGRAHDEYLESLRLAPNSAETLNGLGKVAQKQGKTREAIDYFTKAVTLDPRFADAFNDLGVAYEAAHNLDLAKANYRKALQIDPQNRLARQNLARLSAR